VSINQARQHMPRPTIDDSRTRRYTQGAPDFRNLSVPDQDISSLERALGCHSVNARPSNEEVLRGGAGSKEPNENEWQQCDFFIHATPQCFMEW
jgi:hypothetical protein